MTPNQVRELKGLINSLENEAFRAEIVGDYDRQESCEESATELRLELLAYVS